MAAEADHSADPLADLVKRASDHLARKLSGLLVLLLGSNHAGSFGALAGLALAAVLAWGLLRPPRRKRATDTGGRSRGAATSSEIYRQLVSLRESEAVGVSRSPLELGLGEIVKKKLNGGRKITCQLLGVILEERSSQELQKHATVRPSVVDILHQLTRFCDFYLRETVDDDESEVPNGHVMHLS